MKQWQPDTRREVTCVRNPGAGCDLPPRGVRLGSSPTSSSGKQNKRHEVIERATQNEAEPGSHFAAQYILFFRI
jgi:hypothetical protein